MILLNSTIKGKHEVKTASKWKGGETPPKDFPYDSSSKWQKLSPSSQCPVGGFLTRTTLLPPIFNRFLCLRLTGPPCRESADILVKPRFCSRFSWTWTSPRVFTPPYKSLFTIGPFPGTKQVYGNGGNATGADTDRPVQLVRNSLLRRRTAHFLPIKVCSSDQI